MITDTLSTSIRDLRLLLQPSVPPPSMPKHKSYAQDVLGLFSLFLLTALLQLSAVSGLAKPYTKNDFKDLCQTPNTSQLPSMHINVGVSYRSGIPHSLTINLCGVPGVRAQHVISDQ
ncbi:hypothetical protein V8B97DRAFT_1988472 [Scleroderma yunnanense]